MQPQIIILALPIEEELLKPLYGWGKRFDWSHVAAVHIIHIVKKNMTPLEFGLMELPDENSFREMAPILNKFMEEESNKIIPSTFHGEKCFHLDMGFHPTEEMANFCKRLKANLIVVSTRGKHGIEGFFHSSFTEHMARFAPCDVYVVRP